MHDLVTRLRDHRELLGYDEPLLMEAAAEVERLGGEVRAATESIKHWRAEAERLTKRDEVNAKLRADQDDYIVRLTADLAAARALIEGVDTLKVALEAIAALDYTRGATNGAPYRAHALARTALTGGAVGPTGEHGPLGPCGGEAGPTAELAAVRTERDEGFRELAQQHAKITRELAAARAQVEAVRTAAEDVLTMWEFGHLKSKDVGRLRAALAALPPKEDDDGA